MDIISIDSEQLESITYLSEGRKVIGEYFTHFIARLESIARDEEIFDRLGVRITTDTDQRVLIESPLGNASSRLVLCTVDRQLLGKWAIRKEVESITGSAEYPEVTAIYFTTQGMVLRGLSDSQPIRARANIIHSQDQAAYNVLLSLIYLLGLEPGDGANQ